MTLLEAIDCVKEITKLYHYTEEHDRLIFRHGVEIICSAEPKDIAERLLTNNNIGVNPDHVFCFLRNKVFKIPNASTSLILNLLREPEIMEREIRIMNYKLKHLDKFPEMKRLCDDKETIKAGQETNCMVQT